ncbi:MAG: alpha-(1-_3)-arabinofuranosyltransferase domain-containing protein, partial [Acidimicrobiales bacterium]
MALSGAPCRPRRHLPSSEPRSSPRRNWLFEHAGVALVALLPQLLAERGVVSSDTKAYLYIDPTRFLSQVTSVWDPTVALGTVTHQYVGYLFPMGPYYALASVVHLDLWIAQRIWLAAILYAAGAGVLRLCNVVSLRGPGRVVAALAFAFSPYILQYSGRISVILLPFAALPWLVVFCAEALRTERPAPGYRRPRLWRWRYPALFALVVVASSGINASSFLYVAVAPVLWLVWAVLVERTARLREAVSVLARIVVLSVLVSAWWIAGLLVEAGFGVDVLRYTETVRATSSTSSPLEVLRGLGYWYFYGGGRLGPWTGSVVFYTRWLWLVALSYFVPFLALCAGVAVRWRH